MSDYLKKDYPKPEGTLNTGEIKKVTEGNFTLTDSTQRE